jgi:sugar transferase EpsL
MQKRLKRVIDVLAAAFGLMLLLPLFAVLALAIRWTLGAPVLFRQLRAGQHGRLFQIYKFRTMTNATGESGRLLPDELRLSPFGSFIRSLSLDELPQLWNVLRGDMSFVGPRPLLPEYLPRYSTFQSRRHEVRPGVTGWAQIQGRNTLTWQAKFEFDVWYVDHGNLLLDARILVRTIRKVMTRDGISRPGFATAPPFLGEPPRHNAEGGH